MTTKEKKVVEFPLRRSGTISGKGARLYRESIGVGNAGIGIGNTGISVGVGIGV